MAKKYDEVQQVLAKQHYQMFVCTQRECAGLREALGIYKQGAGQRVPLCGMLGSIGGGELAHKISRRLTGAYLQQEWEQRVQDLLYGGPEAPYSMRNHYYGWVRQLWITKLLNYSNKFHYSEALEAASKNNRR
jgi:hypothetical protein